MVTATTMSRPLRAPDTADYVPSLTGVRGVLALIVFGAHFTAVGLTLNQKSSHQSLLHRTLEALFAHGSVAVMAFFVLSGFVLTWISRPGDRVRDFYQRRFAKVYPIHAITTAVALVLVITSFGVPVWYLIGAHFALVHAWVPSQFFYFGLNGPTWSLACEAFFYLCFPALIVLLRRASARGLYLTIAVCVTLTFTLPALVNGVFNVATPDQFEMVPTAGEGGPFTFWFAYPFPLMRLPEFVAGMALALLVRSGRWYGPNVAIGIVLAVIGWEINNNLPGYLHFQAGMLVPVILLLGALAKADAGGGWSPLRWGPLVWFGEVSFSFYASHLIVQEQIVIRIGIWMYHQGWVPDNTVVWHWYQALPFMALDFVIAVLVAWLLYRLVELPMQRLLRPRRKPAAVAAPPAEGDAELVSATSSAS
jgi:peptidoglycan/LPS O-acetylase OafA/YrhL